MTTPAPFAWNFCPICGKPLTQEFDTESYRPCCRTCNRFFYRNPAPAVCCIVGDANGGLLVVQRAEEPCRGLWSLPGGYIELGESGEDAARRELEEETGLRATQFRLFGVRAQECTAHGSILLLAYVAESWTGELCSPHPDMTLGFFAPNDRPALCFDLHRQWAREFDALAGLSAMP